MIQLLATKHNKLIAYLLLLVFECSFVSVYSNPVTRHYPIYTSSFKEERSHNKKEVPADPAVIKKVGNKAGKKPASVSNVKKGFIGGPNQPEMSSFKSVGTDNMVNLFTGDFSYNIPLLDVGGYPVNIFYDGSVTMEQEASWVGLGWNINPGTVNRNMRGVPDDFDGTDVLKQTQLMKPNVTWGFTAGFDLELVGIKDFKMFSGSAGATLDLSFNNYLGPALGLGIKGATNVKIGGLAGSEKASAPVKIGGGISANINSRSGVTLSPNVSLTSNSFGNIKGFSTGIGLGTSFNSRSGIKQLQLSEQMSYSYSKVKEGNEREGSRGIMSSSVISFSKPSYIPSLRMPLTNEAYSGHFQLGNALFGVYGSAEVEAYKQISRVAQPNQQKPLVGYLYYEKAVSNPNAVMDFTRFNDNEVTPNTPIISAPQYSYDVFSIQGEGTGGSIRAYRNDMGYVRDNITRSVDKNISGGVDVGIPGHFGANFNTIKTPTVISEWDKGNKLRNNVGFASANKLEENVYFRNPGETSVLNNNQFNKIGGTDLVRFKLGGTNASPTIEPFLEQFSKTNTALPNTTDIRPSPTFERKKRTQVTSFLRADEAAQIGLDKKIKNYNGTTVLTTLNNLESEDIERVGEYRKAHHISQIHVTEGSGRRYVYGIPVYNITQKDFTFSVNGTPTAEDQISFPATNNSEEPPGKSLLDDKGIDGFVQVTETPAYAHSFLLTGLLSPDYVDVTANGISEDDLGDAVKFNYSRTKNGTAWVDHQWRTPSSPQSNMANFNDGNRSEKKDDKGIVSYGKRESWYMHSIESKTMIALFTLDDRKDGKGVLGEQREVDGSDNSQKRLKKIDLYSKSDLKKNGLGTNGARPIKTVWFTYSYSLCGNTPSNNNGIETLNGMNVNSAKGKLTLDGIYFTFNGKNRANKNKYVFSYTNTDGSGNPAYALNASDRWGNYKPASNNPSLPNSATLKNSDHPYSVQNKTIADQNAGAWALKKILLPSGGQIEVEYESDDYAFVQNKRAATMMKIVGIGKDQNDINSKNLYRYENGWKDNFYAFIEVPNANVDIKKTYLDGLEKVLFKLAVNMPKGLEYINCYASIEGENYGKVTGSNTTIWVKLKPVRDDLSPLTLSVLDYLRERLPGQAFRGYDVSESTGLKQIADILGGMNDALKGAFKDPILFLKSQSKAQAIIPERSFVRLNNADGYKYGGGQRVKSVVLKDNWKKMTHPNDPTQGYTSVYGQQYDYTTTEVFNSVERNISSGVASYEPSIGSEENPFQSIIEVSTKLPLGPASYGAIEMPMLDAFFPAPLVGYSKVTVRSVKQGTITAGKKSRSGIGKQVTEFYTAKDFPVYYNHTPFDPLSDKVYHDASVLNFFYKYAIDTRALSQGFIVETNDMHGKLKSQASYAEGDEKTRINYTENFYRNTGSNGLNEKFDFVYASKGGEIEEGCMGVDIELMTDTREFSVKSISREVQGQVDLFPVLFPFWLPFIWPVAGKSENTYRAITATKAISYHGILDKVIVIDKGSMVTTKNLVYDAETGDVVVSQTQNEFDKPIYSINYPAYWAYSGMGLAYKNIDAIYSGVNFSDGKIVSGMTSDEIKGSFESGDEIYIINPGSTAGCNPMTASSDNIQLIWALNKNKNATTLTDLNPDFIFIDQKGHPYSRSGVKFRIVRSGKRNMLQAPVAAISLMTNPVDPITNKLTVNASSKVITASAVEYNEKRKTDKDIIKRYKTQTESVTCEMAEVLDCSGYLEKRINPYCKGLLGNFRPQLNKVFYGNRAELNPSLPTNLVQNGFLSEFTPYWNFTGANLVQDINNNKWVWNTQTTAYNSKGMELETKDALEIFTAAQYGFHKTLPIAIANNSRYNEMFSEGFEDANYNETLNGAATDICLNKHVNFTNIYKGSDVGVNAHTGQYILGVPSQSTYPVNIPVASTIGENFDLLFGADVIKGSLYEEGVIIDDIVADPGLFYPSGNPTNRQAVEAGTTFTVNGHAGMRHSFTRWDSESCTSTSGTGPAIIQGYHKITGHQYVEINQCGQYQFDFELFTDDNSSGATLNSIYQKLNIEIKDLEGNVINVLLAEESIFQIQKTLTAYMDKGIFLFSWESSTLRRIEEPNHVCSNGLPYSNEGRNVIASFAIHWPTGQSTPSGYIAPKTYKTLATLSECNVTKPIAATSAMINPVFTIPSGRNMLFSAWVKQNCGTNACTNKVEIDYGNGTTSAPLNASGPVIEGWQRIEGYFTAPQGVSTASLKFINNSGSPIYFDDIRIHPFNANMKSYVYDPINLRLVAELDANNYASFYEYDEEGTLIRTKAETKQGIKTITETRSFKQAAINQLQ